MGVERHTCVDGMNSPIWDSTGPIMLVGHRSCHACDGGVILVESWGTESPPKEAHFGTFMWVSSRYVSMSAVLR
jgi:hypothetical protein